MCSLLNGVIKHEYILLFKYDMQYILLFIVQQPYKKYILYNLLYYGVYKTSPNVPTGIMFFGNLLCHHQYIEQINY